MKIEKVTCIVRIVRAIIVASAFFSASIHAAYRPVDISNVTGEQKRALVEVWAEVRRMQPMTRECFISERLGLWFNKDGSQASYSRYRYPSFTDGDMSCFVGRGGKALRCSDAYKASSETWENCYRKYRKAWGVKAEAMLVPFKKEVNAVVLNTARYMLKSMSPEQRWCFLATMGGMLFNEQGVFEKERVETRTDNGISVTYIDVEGKDYKFIDPEGREHDIRQFSTDSEYQSRHKIIWRCENLVGAKDIVALFSEDVKAMRELYKLRITQIKEENEERMESLLTEADWELGALPENKKMARIAMAMGLYYQDSSCGGYKRSYGSLDDNVILYLPDGTQCVPTVYMEEKPGILQHIPHDVLLEHYREPIEQMTRRVAKDVLPGLPPVLRDMLRAQLSGKLIRRDGTSVVMTKRSWLYETFDRSWDVKPEWPLDQEHVVFIDSVGRRRSFIAFDSYREQYGHSFGIAYLCVRILGKTETLDLIPPGNVATHSAVSVSAVTRVRPVHTTTINGTTSAQNRTTAMGSTTIDDTDTAKDKMFAQGQVALRSMKPELRRAWLAEGMGFCFTENGEAAYQSGRIANGNAVYVDAQGNGCKLSDVEGRDSSEWTDATNAARIVGYEMLAAPYRDEIRQLAVQTSRGILTSMPTGLRQSWLAERRKFFFIPNSGDPYRMKGYTLESGIHVSFLGSDYARCLYYDPNGKIMPAMAVDMVWGRRWELLYYCESVAGIDAICEPFCDDVEAMQTAFRKRPLSQDDADKTKSSEDAAAVEKPDKPKKTKSAARSNVAKVLVNLDTFNAEPNWKAKYFIYLYSASWCGPCKHEMPKIVEKYPEMKKKHVEIVLMGRDRSKEDAEKYLKDFHAPFPGIMAQDGKELPGFEKPVGIPYAVLVSNKGEVLLRGHAATVMAGWEECVTGGKKRKETRQQERNRGKNGAP